MQEKVFPAMLGGDEPVAPHPIKTNDPTYRHLNPTNISKHLLEQPHQY